MPFDKKFFSFPVHYKSYFSPEVKFGARNIKTIFRVLIAEI